MLLIALTSAIAAVAAPIAGLFGYRALRRRRNAAALRIDAPEGILIEEYPTIGGIQQWISIRGENRDNPVLFELHGGPGASNSIFANRTRAWERDFTIVRWDIRGTGKTFSRNGAGGQGSLTVETILADAIELAEYVRAKLGQEKLVLVANSFGSIFGLHLARRRPDLFWAYVGTDQNICHTDHDPAEHRQQILRLQAAGKTKDAAVLEKMGPDPRAWSADDWAATGKIASMADPRQAEVMKKLVMRSLWFSPNHSLADLMAYLKGMKFSASLFQETAEFDSWADGTEFSIPFFVFQGEQDPLTTPVLAKRFFDDVNAPIKEFAYLTDACHFASFWQPEQFHELLMTRVRPQLATVKH